MIGGRWAGLSVVAMLVGPRPAGAVSICALDRAVSPDGEHRAGEALGFAAALRVEHSVSPCWVPRPRPGPRRRVACLFGFVPAVARHALLFAIAPLGEVVGDVAATVTGRSLTVCSTPATTWLFRPWLPSRLAA